MRIKAAKASNRRNFGKQPGTIEGGRGDLELENSSIETREYSVVEELEEENIEERK